MNEILKLAQNRCANYAEGRCLVTDRTCLYGSPNADIRRCSWFETSVLPSEPAIEMRYYASRSKGTVSGTFCEVCHEPYTPKSNRQKYCPTCSAGVKRKQKHKYNQEYYLRKVKGGRAL
jgi:hypothetical protein